MEIQRDFADGNGRTASLGCRDKRMEYVAGDIFGWVRGFHWKESGKGICFLVFYEWGIASFLGKYVTVLHP